MAKAATRAYDLEPSHGPWRGLCCLLGGVAEHLAGNRKGAVEPTRGGRPAELRVRTDRRLTVPGSARDRRDRRRNSGSSAGELADRAVTIIDEPSLAASPFAALVFAVAAATRARQGRVDEAKRDLRRAADQLVALGRFHSVVRRRGPDHACPRGARPGGHRGSSYAPCGGVATGPPNVGCRRLPALVRRGLGTDRHVGRDRAVGPLIVDDRRASDPQVPSQPPIVSRDRGASGRFGQYGQDPGPRDLSQARRRVPFRGSGARSQCRPARRCETPGSGCDGVGSGSRRRRPPRSHSRSPAPDAERS